MARFKTGTPVDEMSVALEEARRQSRFKAAQERIRKIVDAAPPFTPEQRSQLAVLLLHGSNDDGRR